MKRSGLTLLLIISVSCFLAARPPESSGYHYLEKQKKTIEGISLQLLPDFDQRDELLDSVESNSPEMCLEMLYTMPLPETNGEELYLFLINKLNSVSTMSGIEYYSHNKGGMFLYLEKCYLVSEKGSKRPIPDPEYINIPGPESFVIYQKDTTFGSNWYRALTNVSDGSIRFSMSNINTMRYFLFPVMKPEGVIIDLVVIPQEDHITFYALSQLKKKTGSILGKEIFLPGVFDHRVSAIQGWFARQLFPRAVPGKIQ